MDIVFNFRPILFDFVEAAERLSIPRGTTEVSSKVKRAGEAPVGNSPSVLSACGARASNLNATAEKQRLLAASAVEGLVAYVEPGLLLQPLAIEAGAAGRLEGRCRGHPPGSPGGASEGRHLQDQQWCPLARCRWGGREFGGEADAYCWSVGWLWHGYS